MNGAVRSRPNGGARFVDPRVLARIDRLDLIARTVVDGFMAGLHPSPHLGLSTDFAEHRPYMPGDDVRRVDWRLYGRTDRLYLKEFEAETNADVLLLIDISASMDWGAGQGAGTDAVTKLDYGRYLAACLAYFSHRQRDRIGVVTFDRDVVDQTPASGRQLDTVLHTLDRIVPGGAGELAGPLKRIAKGLRRRGIVVLMSDLYEDPEGVARAAAQLALAGHDLIVFHLLDRRELDFDFPTPRQFEDAESGERIPVIPDRIRDGYQGLMRHHIDRIAARLGELRVEYCQVDTAKPLDHALYDYLARRQRLQRVR
ncbi:MAG: DUF58 domain-containing protein [Acidobacteriota bacterium]